MASIIEDVLKATVGLLFEKCLDLVVDSLPEGDVAEQKFRNMIVREINDTKSKLDGLARKDLLTSISLFTEGIVLLYKVLDIKYSCKKGTATEQGAVTRRSREGTSQLSLQSFETEVKVSLAMDMENLDASAKRTLADAKKRFDEARMKATEAFNNVALSASDRVLAMQYRVMSTILEKIDNPKEAIATCKLCLEELHSMQAVKSSFQVESTGGFLSWFEKNERAQITQSVRDTNSVVFRVTKVADGVLSREVEAWPRIKIREQNVNLAIPKGDNCFHSHVLPLSYGQEGEEEQKLTWPQSITTNTTGQFIVADNNRIKVFDCNGKSLFSFCATTEVEDIIKDVHVATDNVFVLTISYKTFRFPSSKVTVYDEEGHLYQSSDVWPNSSGISVTVNENQRVFVLLRQGLVRLRTPYTVEVCEADGQHVRSFSFKPLVGEPAFITSAGGNHVIVLFTEVTNIHIHIYDEEGNFLNHVSHGLFFSMVQIGAIAFQLSTEHIIIPLIRRNDTVNIEVLTKNGMPVHTVHLETEEIDSLSGIAVTTEGRIAVLCTTKESQRNSEKHLVLVV